MAKGKKNLMSAAPWRGEEEATEEFQDVKFKVTKQQPGAESVMHVPLKKRDKSNRHDHDNNDDDSLVEIDPQLCYSFHCNYQYGWKVVKAKGVMLVSIILDGPSSAKSETRFTVETSLIMFWSHEKLCVSYPEGIANAHKSLGIGQEEKARRVRRKRKKKTG
ncbi:hypothetical protein FCV25MIE_14251 [Fagus crenata]